VRERVGLLNATLANNLGGIATIKAFGAEEREVERVAAERPAYRTPTATRSVSARGSCR
jgi:ATP-binding cassette, subfamily B, bacterial